MCRTPSLRYRRMDLTVDVGGVVGVSGVPVCVEGGWHGSTVGAPYVEGGWHGSTAGAPYVLLACAGLCSGGVFWEHTEIKVKGSYYWSILGCGGVLLKYTGVFVEGCSARSLGVGNRSAQGARLAVIGVC